MIIKSIQVENFHSILCATLELNRLTALVGSNGSGKSSFLRAIELFYADKPQIQNDDFYNKKTDKDIIFTVTFTDLSDDAKNEFQKYYDNTNEKLIIKRKFEFIDDKIINNYYGNILRNPDFKEIRKQSKADDVRMKYEKLKNDKKDKSFPNLNTKASIIEYLSNYEKEHPDECKPYEEKIYFESKDVSEYLKKYVKLLVIPAVRDASLDAIETKNSLLGELVDVVVKKVLLEKDNVKEFKKKFQNEFDILNKDNKQELNKLSKSLTKTLSRYVNDAKIKLLWDPLNDFEIQLPQIIAKLSEDGYASTVNRTGHGLQRVFIMTLLEQLSKIKDNTDESTSTWIFVIDEPELYQHPNRQRHLFEIYNKLSKRKGSLKTQIIYSTHSPHFIELSKIDNIRLLRKVNKPSPKTTTISHTSTAKISEKLKEIHGPRYTENRLKSQLLSMENPLINEGFFSKAVVLVEGYGDREAIVQTARHLKSDLNQKDISIIPCLSVNNLDKGAIMFKYLNIPVYMIWDNDRDNDRDKNTIKIRNRNLLKICKANEENYPSDITKDHAVIDNNLESMLKNTIIEKLGKEAYRNLLKICKANEEDYPSDITKDHAVIDNNLESMLKNTVIEKLGKEAYRNMLTFYRKEYSIKDGIEKKTIVIRDMLKDLYENNKIIPKELEEIVEKIKELPKKF